MKKAFFPLGALVSALLGCGSTGSAPAPSAGASTQSARNTPGEASGKAQGEASSKPRSAQSEARDDTSDKAAIRKQLGDALRAWQSARPRRYRFDYTVKGFAPGGGPWRIEVEEDKVVAVTYVGQAPTPVVRLTAAHAPTVEQLFAEVEKMLNSETTRVKVSFDAALNYPKEAYFDHGMEGDGFQVEGLTKIP